jgi:hypothetical protein
MAKLSARGAQFDIAATFGTTVTVTAATNVASSVVSVGAGHGAVVGDFFEILTPANWARAERRLFRISNVATNDLTFEGFDTSDTNLFPAAGFVGATVRRVATWTTITDVQDFQITGGEQQFTDVTGIGDLIGQQFPTLRAAVQVTLPVFYDPSNAWVSTIRTAANQTAIRALRVRGPSGLRLVQNGYLGWLDAPTIEGDVLRGSLTIAGINIPTVYAT